MRSVFIHIIVASALIVIAPPAEAQHAQPASVARLAVGGVIGGAVGLAAGGFTGAWIGSNHCSDEGNPDSCRPLQGLVLGAAIGQTLSVPLGVHVANGRRGRLGPSLLASAFIGAAGGLIITQSKQDEVLVGTAVGVPVLQIVSSIIIERTTSRRR
jgi:hypothetical protein